MSTNAQTIIRNRNLPSAFYAGQTAGVPQSAPDLTGGSGTLDSARVSYDNQNNLQPDEAQDVDYSSASSLDSSSQQSDQPDSTAPGAPAYDPNAPSAADAQNAALRQSVAAPYLAQMEANRKKIDALKTMPVTDKDGRTRSGIAAFLLSLGENPQLRNVRDWGDLAKGLIYSTGRGVGGAIDKTWNERQKRDVQINKINQESEQLQNQAQDVLKLATAQSAIDNRQSTIDNRERTQNRADSALEERRQSRKVKNLTDDKKILLKEVLSRAAFSRADAEKREPELIAKMDAADLDVEDFDHTKKRIYDKEAGVYKDWNATSGQYEPLIGDEGAEPKVAVLIDGEHLKLTPGQFANYKAQETKTNYDTAKADADNEQEFQDKLQKWQSDEQKRSDEVGKLINDGNQKNTDAIEQENLAKDYESEAARLAEDNPTEAVKLRNEAKKARAKAGTLRTESQSLNNRAQNSKPLPKPAKQAKLPVYQSPVQTGPPVGNKGGKNNAVGTISKYEETLRKLKGKN